MSFGFYVFADVSFQELGLRNYYHRKKLQLALESVAAGTQSPAANLDHNWVTSK